MTFRAFRIFNAGTGGDLVLATGYELVCRAMAV